MFIYLTTLFYRYNKKKSLQLNVEIQEQIASLKVNELTKLEFSIEYLLCRTYIFFCAQKRHNSFLRPDKSQELCATYLEPRQKKILTGGGVP